MGGLLDNLFERSPQEWASLGMALLIAIPIHEFAHALAARWAGDDTAARLGRVTLDPLKHLDPLGTLLILVTGRFGWGKPVPVNPYNFRSPRWGTVWVSLAGPASNVLLALVLSVIFFRFGLVRHMGEGHLMLATDVIVMNLGLACFNLLPVPPLDGSRILLGLLPSEKAISLAKAMDRYGFALLFLLVLTGASHILIVKPMMFLFSLFTGIG